MKTYDYCIIGGGFQGLSLAYELSKKNKIVLIEGNEKLGGVLSSFKLGKSYLEDYYHHFFIQDKHLISLLNELGLADKIIWKTVKSGFNYENRTYPFCSPLDLLFFKPLGWKDRLIFPLFMLKIKMAKLEKVSQESSKDWIVGNSTTNIYKKLFEPLIINKFGVDELEEISAEWFISRIKLRSSVKAGGEVLGYPDGGWQQIIDRLEELIKRNGGDIIISNKFVKFKAKKRKIQYLISQKGKIYSTNFISTIPPKITFNGLKVPKGYIAPARYQGSVCMIVGLNKKVSDIYWTNLVVDDCPFRAVIEHTNLVDKERYGMNVVYLASYHPINSPIWEKKEKEITPEFIDGLKKLFPHIKDEDIVYERLSREKYAGILGNKDFFNNKIPYKTPFDNLYSIGMFNAYPERGTGIQAEMTSKFLSSLKE